MSIARARQLRTEMTNAEKRLWYILRDRRQGYKFRRQFPIGPYICDFVCEEVSLIIELDGGQHCDKMDDVRRTEFLEGQGWQVIRFWNNEVLQQTDAVTETIVTAIRSMIASRPPHLLR